MNSISVIIPTFQRGKVLQRAVASVLRQKDVNLELIIVDDGSTDQTQKLVEEMDSNKIRYYYQENQGVSSARNIGIQHARHPWIAFLDSDDEWEDRKLKVQLNELLITQKLIIHSNEIWMRNGKFLNQMNKHKKRGGFIYEYCLPLCCISPSSVIIHRSVFDNVGLFNTYFPVCEDYELWLRICSKYEVAFCDENLIIKHGGHADQLSQKFFAMDYYRVLALHQMLVKNCLDHTLREKTQRILCQKLKILHQGAMKHFNMDLQSKLMPFTEIYFGTNSQYLVP